MQPDQPKPTPQFDDKIHPDLLAYIKQTCDLEAHLAELREAETSRSYTFEEVLAYMDKPDAGEYVSEADGRLRTGESIMPTEQREPYFQPHYPIPPDLLAWARQTFDEKAFLAELRDAKANGDMYTLDQFIDEIKEKAGIP